MCQSKAEGGKRCGSHLRARLARLQAIEEPTEAQTAEFASITAELKTRDEAAALKSRERAEREEAKRDRSRTRVAGKRQSGGQFASFTLSEAEWATLRARAEERGHNKMSEVLREAIDAPLNLQPVSADALPAPKQYKGTAGGRPRTDETNRQRGKFRLQQAQRARLEREADKFNMSVSDLVRVKLLNYDPRQNHGHMGATPAIGKMAERTRSFVAREAGRTGEEIRNAYFPRADKSVA